MSSTTGTTVLFACLVLAAFAPLAVADSVTYVGQNLVSSGCAAVVRPPNGVDGATCHRVPTGATSADIEIIDAAFGSKGGQYAFDSRAPVAFCAGGAVAAVPAGATWLRVSPTLQAQNVACAGEVSAATTGSVIVVWT